MNSKSLKRLGMGFFLIGIISFISLTFIVDISFKNNDIEGLIESKHESLANKISALESVPPVLMNSELSEAFNKYNDEIENQYGISKSDYDKIIEKLNGDPGRYNEGLIDEVITEKEWANRTLEEYSGWMIDREWSDIDAFNTELGYKISDLNRAAIAEFGLSSDSAKRLKTELMIASAPKSLSSGLWALIIFGLGALGGLIYFIPMMRVPPGINNHHIYHNKSQTAKGPAIAVFIGLVVFYIVLYHFPQFLSNQIALLDPLSVWMSGGASGQWFLYGFLYTLTMFVMGIRMMIKYRGNAYQQVRTGSVFFFQVVFAFTLPQILTRMQLPAYDLKSAWPLEYTFFFDYRVDQYLQEGTLGVYLFFWGIVLFMVGVPIMTYFYGKRWYCSWVCGCGGLAETLGDPYRHLSDKSLTSWKIERYLVHAVLVFAVFMTSWVAYTTWTGEAELLGINSYNVRSTYGFFIGFVFAGAVGTGFYPVMGNRVWCRFGCPLAAYLGLVQRFKSRFRITTNGGQCISCGNCSTHCEMGIDVRWYAQRGQNIVRSSCVGCGVCSAVCPRGVLKLENGKEEGRINDNPILIGREGASLNI